MRDADAARLSDLEELDTSALRIARQQLHRACGALEMVGVTAPAQVLRGMEAAGQPLCTASRILHAGSGEHAGARHILR